MSTNGTPSIEADKDIATERCTIVVMPRDRYSTIEQCLECIFEHTLEPFDLIVIVGGAPDHIRKKLEDSYSSKARFIFKPEFMNGAQMRNMALPLVKTRLAVFIDADVFVRRNWLTPLIRCQGETDAGLVSPIILEKDEKVHTGGNILFISHKNGRAFGYRELRYSLQHVDETTNIPRQEMDFGEIHCQLVVVQDALKLGIYDERLRECHDLDSGLTLKKAGRKMMLEPKSIVYFLNPYFIFDLDDVKFYLWKWDLNAGKESLHHFYEKWKIDLNGRNLLMRYLTYVNTRVGFFSRHYPSRLSMVLDRGFRRIRIILNEVFARLIRILTFDRM